MLVRASAAVRPRVELLQQLAAATGGAGILVLTATERHAASLRAGLRGARDARAALTIESCQTFGKRVLRELDPRYRRGVRVADRTERRAVMRDALRQLGFPATTAAVEHALLALGRIKNQLEGEVVSGFAASQQRELLIRYDRGLQARRSVDEDDLRSRPLRLLRHNPAWLDDFRRRARLVVADDYCRLSPLEVDLVTLLSQENRGLIALCTAPDDERVLRFGRDFPEAIEAGLPLAVLPTAAPTLPAQAAAAARRSVLATWPLGEERLVCYQANDELDEASFVAAEAARLCAAGLHPSEIAVSWRLASAPTVLEDALSRASIPTSRLGWSADDGTRHDVLAYLRLVASVDDDAAFSRALSRPSRGINAAALARLAQLAGSLRLSLAATIPHAAMLSSLPARTRLALREFRGQLTRWQTMREALPLAELVDRVLDESGYRAWAQERQSDRFRQHFERLRQAAEEFERLEGRRWTRFVDAMAGSETQTDGSVRLVPWSQLAGGGEYAVVFLTGLEEGAVPHESGLGDATVLDVERSAYEARREHARVCTFLTYALTRMVEGKPAVRDPSRFLSSPAVLPVSP